MKLPHISFRLFLFPLLAFMLFASSCDREGCTETSALNYDQKATIDDGSCEFYLGSEIDFSAIPDTLEHDTSAAGNPMSITIDDDFNLVAVRVTIQDITDERGEEPLFSESFSLTNQKEVLNFTFNPDPSDSYFDDPRHYFHSRYIIKLEGMNERSIPMENNHFFDLIDVTPPSIEIQQLSASVVPDGDVEISAKAMDITGVRGLTFEIWSVDDQDESVKLHDSKYVDSNWNFDQTFEATKTLKAAGMKPGDRYHVSISAADWTGLTTQIFSEIGTVQ